MKHHSIICRLGPADNTRVKTSRADTQVTEISFVDGHRRLGYGLGQCLDQLSPLGLSPSERALDFALLAAVVTAADTRISRTTETYDRWTREIALHVPVSDPVVWNGVAPRIVQILHFLTGDRWEVYFRPRIALLASLAVPATKRLRLTTPSVVCLFSGGLDSFIGAIDLLAKGTAPMLVSHYWDGITSKHQKLCFELLRKHFITGLYHVRARVGFPDGIISNSAAEKTMRGRSFLFFALAALSADAIGGDVTVNVPENGLISLNVPLDPLRRGSLSTRTTHPFYMARVNDLLHALGLRVQLVNVYRHVTKGMMVRRCLDSEFLMTNAKYTMSCSSPTKTRYDPDENRRQPKHCGHCVPCLIRRAALFEAQGEDDTSYQIQDLGAQALDTKKAAGRDVRSFQVALARLEGQPMRARLDIHGPGPLTDHPGDLDAYKAVYVDGLREVGRLLAGVTARPR